MHETMEIVRLEDVCLERDGRSILKEIDLTIKAGESVAIIGPTGSGKTSLLRIIDLIDNPSRGLLLFKGKALKSEVERIRARRCIGMVFQRPAMLRGTVYDNVAYGLKVRGVSKEEMKERVSIALAEVELDGYEHRIARELSGGEMQRVAIARALAVKPELLLLDEPTANLDPVTSNVIEDLILRTKKKGLTLVISTHDLPQARRVSERLAVMMSGRIISSGTFERLVHSGPDDVMAFLKAGMPRLENGGLILEGWRISHR